MSSAASDRWERVSTIFTAARALDDDVRDAFLTAACAGDVELRAQVELLLAADPESDEFLEDPPWRPLAASVVEGLASLSELAAGQVLADRYCIDSELAAGGQAQVYLAHDQHLMMRPVVIKVVRDRDRRDGCLKAHLEREMQALARIDHPGVVGILDVGELEDGSPFIVIQHIPGISLRELLRRGPLPPARAASILRQMGSALRAAHIAGIAHRDLKPENIMLQPRNDGGDVVRLIDFGIAKVDDPGDPGAPAVTTGMLLAGTVRYMAPEQLDGKHSTASDVYAMALVACEMLCGYPHAGALPASTSRDTRETIAAALAFLPQDRPADVEAWSGRLARSLAHAAPPTRRVVLAATLLLIALASTAVLDRHYVLSRAEPVRWIQKVGAFDPAAEGFEPIEDVAGSGVADNTTRTGYDAWRVVTHARGLYSHQLTNRQARQALERGWRLTAVLRAEEGASYAAVHFREAGRGFPIQVLAQSDHEIVRLPTRVIPDLRGIDYVQQPPGEYHEYQLVYDPILRTANLFVDGELRMSGYAGWNQDPYHLGTGFHFGTAIFESERGVGSFRTVRLEIDP